MPNTFRKISTVSVGAGGASSIDFTSISQDYSDLLVILSLRSVLTTGNLDFAMCRLNGDATAGNYRTLKLAGEGGGSTSGEINPYGSNTSWAVASMNTSSGTNTANTFSNASLYIHNYTSSNNKSAYTDYTSDNNTASGQPVQQGINALLWSNTAAITSISFYVVNSVNFSQYSTATLYGIKKD